MLNSVVHVHGVKTKSRRHSSKHTYLFAFSSASFRSCRQFKPALQSLDTQVDRACDPRSSPDGLPPRRRTCSWLLHFESWPIASSPLTPGHLRNGEWIACGAEDGAQKGTIGHPHMCPRRPYRHRLRRRVCSEYRREARLSQHNSSFCSRTCDPKGCWCNPMLRTRMTATNGSFC